MFSYLLIFEVTIEQFVEPVKLGLVSAGLGARKDTVKQTLVLRVQLLVLEHSENGNLYLGFLDRRIGRDLDTRVASKVSCSIHAHMPQ